MKMVDIQALEMIETGWTDQEITERQLLRAMAEKAPLHMRLLEWPVCLLIYLLLGIAAPFIYIYRILTRRL
jgi:hypothetical protein